MKKMIIILCVLMFIFTTGCGNQKKDAADLQTSTSSEYCFETDHQYATAPLIAYSKDGYYRLKQQEMDRILMFHDYKTNKDIPVCAKSDCDHNNEQCDAFFSYKEYHAPYISFYNDNLYVLKTSNGYHELEKISLDGSKREKSCNLYKQDTETTENENGYTVSNYYPEIAIHRGYVYYSTYYPGNEKSYLYRVKLDSEENPELLYEQDGDYPCLYGLKGIGNNLYFESGFSEDDEWKNSQIKLYKFDIDSCQVTEFLNNENASFTVYGNYVFYFDTKDNLMRYDISSKEEVKITDKKFDLDNFYGTMFVKNDKLYLSWEGYAEDAEDAEEAYQYEISLDGKDCKKLTDTDMISFFKD